MIVAALFDEEDPEGELFAPYWGQQEVDWENPPEEDNGLGQVWYEVCKASIICAQVEVAAGTVYNTVAACREMHPQRIWHKMLWLLLCQHC